MAISRSSADGRMLLAALPGVETFVDAGNVRWEWDHPEFFGHPPTTGRVSPTGLAHAASILGRVGELRRRQLARPGVVYIMTIEMATSPQQIDALLGVRSEDEHLEFKAAENRYDFEELVDYCVALANEGGGRMILGVTDKVPRRVVGTKAFDVPERTVAGIYERLGLKAEGHVR